MHSACIGSRSGERRVLVKSVGFVGHRYDRIEGYLARSLLAEPTPGVGALHHAPGLDPWRRELVRNFVSEGFTESPLTGTTGTGQITGSTWRRLLAPTGWPSP